MRVERVGVDKVKERLSALKQKEEAAKTAVRAARVCLSVVSISGVVDWLAG